MHNGFVRIDDEKMSKSLGNFFTVREVLKSYTGEEMRLFILGSHYRSPLNYSTAQLKSFSEAGGVFADEAELDTDALRRFNDALDDDLNTAEAVSVLHDVANGLNKATAGDKAAGVLANTLKQLGARLGLLTDDPVAMLQRSMGDEGLDEAAIDALINERIEARAAKDFARSDEIRDTLVEAGIVLEDKDGKTTWRRS